jgi:hypothetical protein
MSFTKTQDLTDVTALETKLTICVNSKGTRNEARAKSDYETERNTVNGRSVLNGYRLGLDYINVLVDAGDYAAAKAMVTNMKDRINQLP